MNRARFDFFDVDHTITRHATAGRFMLRAIARGLAPWPIALVLPWYGLAYRLGILHVSGRADIVGSLRGVSRADLEAVARETFAQRVRADLNPSIERLIREHLAEGRRVVLATSTLDIIVAPLAAHLGVRDVLATTLEFEDGAATGRVAGRPLIWDEKRRKVLAFIREAREDPRRCSFHADSIYDLPLLEEVGEPVAVNPDFRLRRIARHRGWTVID